MLEEKLSSVEKEIEENAANYSRLFELTSKKEEIQTALDEKMERWVYLNDLAEKIDAQKKEKL